jgi:hypothetical protein
MFGCLRRLGCLVILLILLAAAWFWYARVEPSRSPASTAATSTWQPLTQPDAARAQRAIESLGNRSGPVFANLSAGEVASYAFLSATKGALPPSAQNISAAVIGDRIYVRATVILNELGGKKVLGPLASLLSDRDSVRLGGTMNVIQPGLGQFLVQEVRLGSLAFPSKLVPALVQQFRRGNIPPGVAPNGLPMPLPSYISDIRISNGRVTIYKNTP